MTGLEFDPGFAPYIMNFQGTVEYLYSDINRFRNLSQKKVKFLQYHKNFLKILDNNIGFYIGCLMWAAYIKTQPKQNIINNNAFGTEFDEQKDTKETNFMIKFVELFPKDMKYFLGKHFEFDSWVSNILETYKEFLIINKGFVNCEFNTDVKLPQNIETEDAENYLVKIRNVIDKGDLSLFLEYKNIIVVKSN